MSGSSPKPRAARPRTRSKTRSPKLMPLATTRILARRLPRDAVARRKPNLPRRLLPDVARENRAKRLRPPRPPRAMMIPISTPAWISIRGSISTPGWMRMAPRGRPTLVPRLGAGPMTAVQPPLGATPDLSPIAVKTTTPRIPAALMMAPIRARREILEIPATRETTAIAAADDDDVVDVVRTMDRPRKAAEVRMEALMAIAAPVIRVVAIGDEVPITATRTVVRAVRAKAIRNRRAFRKRQLPFREFSNSIRPRVTGFFATRRVNTFRSRPTRLCRVR